MENIFTETMKMVATNFATWMEDNAWTAVWSDELKIRAYVDASKNDILVNGSDYHFTKLIKESSKNLDELYEMFILDERRRLKTLNKADVSGSLQIKPLSEEMEDKMFKETTSNDR